MNRRRFISGISLSGLFVGLFSWKGLLTINRSSAFTKLTFIPHQHHVRHGALYNGISKSASGFSWLHGIQMHTFYANGISLQNEDLKTLQADIEGNPLSVSIIENKVTVDYNSTQYSTTLEPKKHDGIQLDSNFKIHVLQLNKGAHLEFNNASDLMVVCFQGSLEVNNRLVKNDQSLEIIQPKNIVISTKESSTFSVLEKLT